MISEDQIKMVLDQIEKADAIIIGTADDFAETCGLAFSDNFAEFEDEFGFHDYKRAFKFRWRREEQRWAFFTRLIDAVENEPKAAYEDLAKLVAGKEHFVLTTSFDGKCAEVFGQDKVIEMKGNANFLQCEKSCEDKLYPAEGYIEGLKAALHGTSIDSDAIPYCPECEKLMVPWVYSYDFMEGERYKSMFENWNKFLQENINSKILFLAVGLGTAEPERIRLPFWQMCNQHPNAFIISIENERPFIPSEIEDKGMCVEGNVVDTVHELALAVK